MTNIKYDLHKDTLYEHDIVPYGDFETVPVEMSIFNTGIPEILTIPNMDIDADRLYTDFKRTRDIMGTKIVSGRAEYLKDGMTFEKVVEILDEIGFNRDTYCAWPLRKLGTNELLDEVGDYTRELIGRFGVTFRQQYAMAFAGWETTFHYDHQNTAMHGFKVHIPLNVDAWFAFEIDGVVSEYCLEVGKAYFVDVTKLHKGKNLYDVERVNLTFQLASDQLLKNGIKL